MSRFEDIKRQFRFAFLVTGLFFTASFSAAQTPAGGGSVANVGKGHLFWAYIGNTTSDGIALYKLDTDAGTLTAAGIAGPANAPGFLAIAPNQKFLYSTMVRTAPSGKEAGVEAFAIDAKTGKLTPLNDQPSGGEEACFVTVDQTGKNALAAHYAAATVSVLPIGSDGKLSPRTVLIKQTGSSKDPERQTHAYAHSINTDPTDKYAIACDLGADKLFIYKFDAEKSTLTANDPASVSTPPGSGPRHLTFHPNGKWAYVVTEMGGTVIGYNWDASRGQLQEFGIVPTLPSDFKGTNTSAEVQIDPTGRFLYASNRIGSNFLTIYSIDQSNGKLTLVGYQPSIGRIPRNFRIDPTGKFMIVANQESNNLVLFRIDQNSGKLTQVGEPMSVRSPICVKFLAVEGG